jgi:hypothetical protein
MAKAKDSVDIVYAPQIEEIVNEAIKYIKGFLASKGDKACIPCTIVHDHLIATFDSKYDDQQKGLTGLTGLLIHKAETRFYDGDLEIGLIPGFCYAIRKSHPDISFMSIKEK